VLSHDLAQELLARRNNDVRIQVLIDDGSDDYLVRLVELRADEITLDDDYRDDPVVGYDAFNDVVIIRAGLIVTQLPDGGEPDA
jgi:hypothetical protein